MISDEELYFIRRQLDLHQLEGADLTNDLVDHFCCIVEEQMSEGNTFNEAFDIAFKRISPDGPKEIEKDLIYLLTIKRKIMFKKSAYVFGYISLILVISGILFVPFFQSASVHPSERMDELIALSGMSVNGTPKLQSLFSLSTTPSRPSLSELLWGSGFAVFLLTVVPFWFYKAYQKSILKLQKS
ncbi:MAG: hypothetical protein HEP71_32290 [Roseivirga sp.]|nr:hypothetical protein [Roseivirga sp.]